MAKQMQGQRLPYVVVPLKGEVEVLKRKYDKRDGKIVDIMAKEPAGWLLLYPKGHYLRIRRAKDLVLYGLNKKPAPINQDGTLLHPAQNLEKAYENMQADIVAQVKKVSGEIKIPGFTGTIPLPKHQMEESYA